MSKTSNLYGFNGILMTNPEVNQSAQLNLLRMYITGYEIVSAGTSYKSGDVSIRWRSTIW